METKFSVGQEVAILPAPGWTGTVVMIDIRAGRYLLDCHPGALNGYVYYQTPDGLLAGNWFDEHELEAEVRP